MDTPLNCFPMRIDWEATLPVLTAEPFPAPALHSRMSRALTFPMPDPVLKLSEFAREHSWDVRVQYSQGYQPHVTTGRPGALKDVIGLRFGAHPMTDRQAYAIYMRNAGGGEWAWDSVMIWGRDLLPFGGCGVTELRDYLEHITMPVADITRWVMRIRGMRAESEALKKRRDAVRKQARATFDQVTLAGHALPWPARLLAAYVESQAIIASAADVYTREDLIKIIETRKVDRVEGR